MNSFLNLFNDNKDIQLIVKKAKEKTNLFVTNCSDNHKYLLSSMLLDNNFVFYVTNNVYKATKAYDSISKILGYDKVNLYVSSEVVACEVDATNKELEYERLNTLSNIIKSDKKVIVTTINSVLKELMPKEDFQKAIINLEIGKDYNRRELIESLIKIGYRKMPTTDAVGYFSVRGEIIDIFPINSNQPIRIVFFDTEIEDIKYYDKTSQISLKNNTINNIDIFPNTELIISDPKEVIHNIGSCTELSIMTDINDIENYSYNERLTKYLKYIFKNTNSILEYTDDKIIIFDDENQLKESFEKTINELYYFLDSKPIYKNYDFSFYYDFYKAFSFPGSILTSEFKRVDSDVKLHNMEFIDIKGYSVVNYHNNIKILLEEIIGSDNRVIINITKKENINLMSEILNSKGIEFNTNTSKVLLTNFENAISIGFYNNLSVIDESNIYKKSTYKASYRSTNEQAITINSKDDLKPGDYIVHIDYGIGQYLGIQSKMIGDFCNDFISLKFSDINLYIPVENINMLEKYQGEEGYIPKLTKVATNEWEKKKEKIKEKLLNIARDLILLQAFRESKQGYKYKEDEEIQREFENDFEYVETKDQLAAIDDIKKDMEEGKIVDRLVCGDVGYGKTEVAIRIAMKTIINGKQVAFLAPTTILTRQHFFTFKERMEKYGVRVECLNRLITEKKKKQIINDLKAGKVDVIIGTHILLNDKIEYKDLGLLIIDEEQRFGVTHKEKIKQYKNNINVVTLTATPIPRTLQMSIMGARQMSLIETSPLNRYPVQTYILEQNDTIIREAIYNELGRDGQVFYMHNKISDLDRVYTKIKKMVPEARVIIAHGQMDKTALEDAVQAFIDHEYDVLLCTSIIETGIDIPNTNTLIVELADRLGLAQMYQIRGRVGRTDRISYAYFMYEKAHVLTKEGEQRLNAIKEFTSLGSGYKIAVRDLAIRGAGDFLGKEQSGYIDSIGMDLYMRLLNESINEINGVEVSEENKKIHTIDVSKHIDDSYVSDDDIKIYIHKIINKIETYEDKEQVINELTDRFGKINDTIMIYINKCYFDSLVNCLGIEEVTENDFKVKMIFSREVSEKFNPQAFMKKVYESGENFSAEYKNKKYYIYLIKIVDQKRWIYNAVDFLENLKLILNK